MMKVIDQRRENNLDDETLNVIKILFDRTWSSDREPEEEVILRSQQGDYLIADFNPGEIDLGEGYSDHFRVVVEGPGPTEKRPGLGKGKYLIEVLPVQ